MAVLQDMTAVMAEMARLREENARLKAGNGNGTGVRANALGTKNKQGEDCKGTVSVYGIQRFPISLYPKQWYALLDKAEEIRKCILDNKDVLSWGKE